MIEQTSFAGGNVVIMVETIDNASGDHVAGTIDTTTTRLHSAGGSPDYSSTVPSVETVGTGKYIITFAGLVPATTVGQAIMAKVNGTTAGGAWTEKGVKVVIVPTDKNHIEIGTSYRYTNDNSGAY